MMWQELIYYSIFSGEENETQGYKVATSKFLPHAQY